MDLVLEHLESLSCGEMDLVVEDDLRESHHSPTFIEGERENLPKGSIYEIFTSLPCILWEAWDMKI